VLACWLCCWLLLLCVGGACIFSVDSLIHDSRRTRLAKELENVHVASLLQDWPLQHPKLSNSQEMNVADKNVLALTTARQSKQTARPHGMWSMQPAGLDLFIIQVASGTQAWWLWLLAAATASHEWPMKTTKGACAPSGCWVAQGFMCITRHA
jgi:hypothetical protein